MKIIKHIRYLIIIFFILYTNLSGATGWERSTNVSGIENGLYCHNPVISSGKEILTVAWEEKDRKKKNTSLLIVYGPDERSFEQKILYTSEKEYNLQPAVQVINNMIIVAYSGPDGEIYTMRGKNKGKLWSLPKRMTFTPS
ncbi:MAG: hypothetical protein KKH98_10400, partial [Spirochaetes bacterium]|nr:hypothetical protein [Spirochaetota bacterium]